MATKKKVRKVFAYRIDTPLFYVKKNEMNMNHYDTNRFQEFLKAIVNENDRKLHIDHSKLVRLETIQDSNDSDFLEGIFIASRFGEEQDIINVDTLSTTGKLMRRESVKGEVSFILCKKSGLLLVQSDSSLVINRNSIDTYLTAFVPLMRPYISAYNQNNKDTQITHESTFFTIRTVPSDDFFKKIRELARVKGASVFVNTKNNPQNAAIDYFRNEAEENQVDNFGEIRITLMNKVMGTGVRNVENFFRTLVELQKYDKYEIEGKTHAGRNKTVTMGLQDTSFEVKVLVNDNGVVDRSSLIEEMVRIAKFRNPLEK
ncbi:hypothetical protein AV654_02425 [Paenibacillus elgii]|uniref:Uncharacterized protein n=1 Tax=Paenibacillus elgii TaxID=189691 RepID=A0A161SDD2_9BACL|nr:hypothetical protein [Paenibacillus elgii]KZE78625.1 hypothetical protein AV654_02425 [Paenibacillus elgii]